MGSVGAGLASVGGSIAQAEELQRKEKLEQAKLALQQGELGVQQQYARSNADRLTMDKQREQQLQKLRDAQISEIMKRVNSSPAMVQKLKDSETALGRPLTDTEKLASLGIRPPAVHEDEYTKTLGRLRAESEMFAKDPKLARLLHPGRAPAGGAAGAGDTKSIADKAKDVESGALSLKDLSIKERADVATYMREHKMKAGTASKGGLKPEMEAGLRVLHVSLFGTSSMPGLQSTVGVLDSPASRTKLIAAGVGTSPDPKQWSITKLAHAGMYSMMTQEERNYVYQLNRAISAINALRSITGLPRSTQALMDRYVLELPNPTTTPSSKDALNQLQLIEREIQTAMQTGGGVGDAGATPAGGATDPAVQQYLKSIGVSP